MMDEEPTGERGLAAAVILLALRDLQTGDIGGRLYSEARHFLTDRSGAWARSRETWCDLAGMPEQDVRERAQAIVAQDTHDLAARQARACRQMTA